MSALQTLRALTRGSAVALLLSLPPAACSEGQPPVGPAPSPADGPAIPAPAGGLPSTPRALLVTELTSVDFGEVWQGAVLEQIFELASAGEVDAEVIKIRNGCACTVADAWTIDPQGVEAEYAEGDPIPVGHTLKLRVKADTASKSGRLPMDITLYANIPGNALDLSLLADVRLWLEVSPPLLSFERLPSSAQRRASFEVRSTGGEPFLLLAHPEPPLAGLKLEPRAEEPGPDGRSEEWSVDLELPPDLERGLFRQRLRLDTDVTNPEAPIQADGSRAPQGIDLWVVAHVVDPVDVSKAAFAFGVLRPGFLSADSVTVESYDPDFTLAEPGLSLVDEQGQPFEPAASLRVAAHPVEDRDAWRIELSTGEFPEDFDGPFRGRVLVEVGHPQVPRLTIPFSGVYYGPGMPAGGN